jgi:cell wall-associated NlpC family hydrolase
MPRVAPAGAGDLSIMESQRAARAVTVAIREVGQPYTWGGSSPLTGFDCSGLCEYAYGQAGVSIPRTSEAQWAAPFRRVSPAALIPGDLVYSQFPGDGQASPGHVVMYIGGGQCVAAPHPGTFVQYEPLNTFTQPGIYVGANRPAPSNKSASAAGVQLTPQSQASQSGVGAAVAAGGGLGLLLLLGALGGGGYLFWRARNTEGGDEGGGGGE